MTSLLTFTVLAISFAVVAGLTTLVGALLLNRWAAVRPERLRTREADTGPVSIFRWDHHARAAWQRTLEWIGEAVGPQEHAARSRYGRRLVWAGYPNPHAVTLLIGTKVALGILLGLSYLCYGMLVQRVIPLPRLVPVSVLLAVAGFFLPDFWLHNRITARRRAIVEALPDVLDLLMVCVEAGMGFDAAVARVAEQPEVRDSPLHQEMLRMHLEVRAGRPRQEALRAFGERTGVQEVKAVVGAFVQSERLGTSLGKTLRVHADSARVQRRHRAEERAQVAPLKMIFPTVFFLMPAFVLVAMGPSVLGLLRTLKALEGQ